MLVYESEQCYLNTDEVTDKTAFLSDWEKINKCSCKICFKHQQGFFSLCVSYFIDEQVAQKQQAHWSAPHRLQVILIYSSWVFFPPFNSSFFLNNWKWPFI